MHQLSSTPNATSNATPNATPPGDAALSILVVEDDARLSELLVGQLAARGHRVAAAGDVPAATRAVANAPYDLILLDRMLPSGDGVDALRWLREEGVATPVIVLSALGRTGERIEGLDAGADDYMVKPFDSDELEARMRAVLRRRGVAPADDSATIAAGDVTVSLVQHRATRAGRSVELHKTELRLLTELVRNAGTVMTRAMLLERVWGYDFVPTTNIVDAYIRRLRLRLEVPGLPDPIVTIRGVGYMIRA